MTKRMTTFPVSCYAGLLVSFSINTDYNNNSNNDSNLIYFFKVCTFLFGHGTHHSYGTNKVLIMLYIVSAVHMQLIYGIIKSQTSNKVIPQNT